MSCLYVRTSDSVVVMSKTTLPPSLPSACHTAVLKLFEGSGASCSILDLSTHGLGPHHASPLCQALHGQHTLSSLSLSGNRLKDDAMRHIASALAHLPTLHCLDLSCTGITAQVWEYAIVSHRTECSHVRLGFSLVVIDR